MESLGTWNGNTAYLSCFFAMIFLDRTQLTLQYFYLSVRVLCVCASPFAYPLRKRSVVLVDHNIERDAVELRSPQRDLADPATAASCCSALTKRSMMTKRNLYGVKCP